MKNILIKGRSQWLLNRLFLHKRFSISSGNLSLFSILFIILLSFSTTTVQGQSISRQVIGITGGSTATNFGSISWTVGQTAVAHVKSNDQEYSITQGFQQPNIQVVPTHTFENPLVSIAPNPVIDILNVTVVNPQAENTTFNLIDQLGRVLISNGNLKTWSNELDLSNYPAGSYLLQVQQPDAKIMQTYKVLKVQ